MVVVSSSSTHDENIHDPLSFGPDENDDHVTDSLFVSWLKMFFPVVEDEHGNVEGQQQQDDKDILDATQEQFDKTEEVKDDMDAILANEMNRMSVQEREVNYEDIHGVSEIRPFINICQCI